MPEMSPLECINASGQWEFEFSLNCRILVSDEKTLYSVLSYQHRLGSSIVLISARPCTHFIKCTWNLQT